jgi:hypothetical protein
MYGLVLIVTWIDDCLIVGNDKAAIAAKEQLKARLECDDVGELNEYIGCKIERTDEYIKLT